ncbi:MAG: WD40 repeat domain-containing protein [Alphaproteobacteria bacterium]|nr:WD40 repeat domain-containing protein [Alphaproteobacteria bacterium]
MPRTLIAPPDPELDTGGFYLAVIGIDLSPDGARVVAGDAAEWHHNGGDVLLMAPGEPDAIELVLDGGDYHGECYTSAFSPDGALLALGPVEGMDDPWVLVVDGRTGAQRWTAQVFDHARTALATDDPNQVALAWSPDGRVLAAGAWARGGLFVLSAKDGQPVGAAPTAGGVGGLCWHPEGSWLAVGGVDGRIALRDEALNVRAATAPTGEAVVALAVSADGARVAAVDTAGQLRFFQVTEGGLTLQSRRPIGFGVAPAGLNLSLVALADGGFRVAWQSDETFGEGAHLFARDLPFGPPLQLDAAGVTSQRLVHGGRVLIAAGLDCGVVAWDLPERL